MAIITQRSQTGGFHHFELDIRALNRDSSRGFMAFISALLPGNNELPDLDFFLMARAISMLLKQSPKRLARGEKALWNDYEVILSTHDFTELEQLGETGSRGLIEVIEENIQTLVRTKTAILPGSLSVAFKVAQDDEPGPPPGTLWINARYRKDRLDSPLSTDGEHTVRLGEQTFSVESTLRVDDQNARPRAGLKVEWLGHSVFLQPNRRTILGRPHSGGDTSLFVPLVGASGTVNSEQMWIEWDEDDGQVEVTFGRLNDANYIQVDGITVPAGTDRTISSLPVEVSLSGTLTLHISWTAP